MKILFIAALFLLVCSAARASAVFHGEYAPDLGVFEPSSGISELCLNGAWQFMGAESAEADPAELEPDDTPISPLPLEREFLFRRQRRRLPLLPLLP